MKKGLITFSLILIALGCSFAQTKQQKFQGIWQEIIIDPDSKETHVKIIAGIYSMAIAHQENDDLDFFLSEAIEGFVNTNSFERIKVDSFDEDGMYYIIGLYKNEIINGWIEKKNCIVGWQLYFEDDNLIIEGGRLAEYVHCAYLLPQTMRLLYKRGKKDNRNYLKEYLNIDVTEVVSSKSTIYAEPDKPTKMYLIKGDIVTVLEEKEGWIKMEYEGKKLITGWIKKKDTKK
jgi:hypothetical protein